MSSLVDAKYPPLIDKKAPTATKKWLIFDIESIQDVATECVESYTPRRDPDCLTCTDTTTCSNVMCAQNVQNPGAAEKNTSLIFAFPSKSVSIVKMSPLFD